MDQHFHFGVGDTSDFLIGTRGASTITKIVILYRDSVFVLIRRLACQSIVVMGANFGLGWIWRMRDDGTKHNRGIVVGASLDRELWLLCIWRIALADEIGTETATNDTQLCKLHESTGVCGTQKSRAESLERSRGRCRLGLDSVAAAPFSKR
jgi:hypothetical protein